MPDDNESSVDHNTSLIDHSNSQRPFVANRYTEEGLESAVENTGIRILDSFGSESDEPESDEARWLRESRIKHETLKWWRRPSVLYACIVLTAISITDSLIIPPTTLLAMKRICENIATDGSTLTDDQISACDPARVQQILSKITSIAIVINGVVGTLMAGKLGEISDRIGRVPVFIYMGILKIVSISILLYVFSSKNGFSYSLLVVGQCLPSLGGSMMGLISNGNSYVSDIVESEMRPISISFVMSTIYGAMGLGPFLGSLLIRYFDGNNFVPMWAALSFAVMITLVCAFLMTESRHEEAKLKSQNVFVKRRQSMESVISQNSTSSTGSQRSFVVISKYTIWHFLDMLSPIKKLWLSPTAAGSLIPRYMVLSLITIDVLFISSSAAIMPALVLTFTFLFKWNTEHLGYFISMLGLGRAAFLLIVAPLILRLLKHKYKFLNGSLDKSDIFVIRLSTIFICLSIVSLFLIHDEMAVYCFTLFQVLGGMLSPTIQSTVVKYGSKSNTGEYFGAIALVRSLAMLVMPPILLTSYASSVDKNPKLFLYIPLACSILACLMTIFLKIVYEPELLRRPSEVKLPCSQSTDVTNKLRSAQDSFTRRDSAAKMLRLPTSN